MILDLKINEWVNQHNGSYRLLFLNVNQKSICHNDLNQVDTLLCDVLGEELKKESDLRNKEKTYKTLWKIVNFLI